MNEIFLAKEYLWISSRFSIISFQSVTWNFHSNRFEISSTFGEFSSINRRFLYNYSSYICSFDIYSFDYSQCLEISRRNSYRLLLVFSSLTLISSHWNLFHCLYTKRIRIQMVTFWFPLINDWFFKLISGFVHRHLRI